MSLRILGPPARKVTVFDDGDLPLSSRVVDEDYAFTQIANQTRLYSQPLTDEYVWALPALIVDDDLNAPQFLIVLRPQYAAQPIKEDEILIAAPPGPPLEDDLHALSLQIALKAFAYGQPFRDDETLPLASTILEEDWQAVPARALGYVFNQPRMIEEDFPTALPPPVGLVMPSLIGLNYYMALETLQNAGIYLPLVVYAFAPSSISVQWAKSSLQGGIVLAQSLAAGLAASPGQPITLTVSEFPFASMIDSPPDWKQRQ